MKHRTSNIKFVFEFWTKVTRRLQKNLQLLVLIVLKKCDFLIVKSKKKLTMKQNKLKITWGWGTGGVGFTINGGALCLCSSVLLMTFFFPTIWWKWFWILWRLKTIDVGKNIEHRSQECQLSLISSWKEKIVSKVFDIRIRLFPKRKYWTISKIKNAASEI